MSDRRTAETTAPDPRIRSLARAKDDLRRLMVYASGQHEIEMDGGLIDDVVAVVRAPDQLDEDQEKRMWRALDGLTRLVKPVTGQSLRLIEELENDATERPGLWRSWRNDTPARKSVRWARRWAYGTLLIVVVLQIYALAGSRLIEEIDRIDGSIRELTEQEAQLEGAQGADRLRDAVESHLDEAERNRKTIYEMLTSWVLAVEWLRPRIPDWLSPRPPDAPRPEAAPAPEGSAPKAEGKPDLPPHKSADRVLQGRMLLQAFALHILPVLYGLLGASAYILRRIATEIETCTFAATSIFRYRIRQGLGVVLGLGVGVLPWNIGVVESDISVSSIALAFLAGYNVDAVFSLLDGWMDRLRNRAGVPAQAAAAKAGP
jgi:hypothetical protein